MGISNLCIEAVLRQRAFRPRDEVGSIRLVIDVLELTSATFRKVTTWRHLSVRAWNERPVVH